MSAAPHSDLLARLEAVTDHPADDAPRLVLADWFEKYARTESEWARARFIRLQGQLARMTAAARDRRALAAQPQYQELKAREGSLRREHRTSWLGVGRAWIERPDNEEWWFQLVADRNLEDFSARPPGPSWSPAPRPPRRTPRSRCTTGRSGRTG
jgi:uncharacterized protein (TIGR02996 family)